MFMRVTVGLNFVGEDNFVALFNGESQNIFESKTWYLKFTLITVTTTRR